VHYFGQRDLNGSTARFLNLDFHSLSGKTYIKEIICLLYVHLQKMLGQSISPDAWQQRKRQNENQKKKQKQNQKQNENQKEKHARQSGKYKFAQ
jgi:sortase (surface protein transpeptidase)